MASTRPPVVDTHAHYWAWPAGPEGEAARAAAAAAPAAYAHPPVTPAALLAELDGAGVDKLVQVTRTAMRYDNGYSLEGARANPDRVRVLVRFDPHGDDVDARLHEVLADPLVVGVRVHHFPPEDDWLVDGTYDAVWDGLARAGRPASIYTADRPDLLATIARGHPDLSVVVDHVGVTVMPDSDPARRFDRWDEVLALAELDNVTVKVSGLPEATEESGPFPQTRRRLLELVEAFGPDRLLWGSNFPPSLRVCSYADTLAAIRDALDDLAPHERDLVLGGTACRVLGLPWGAGVEATT